MTKVVSNGTPKKAEKSGAQAPALLTLSREVNEATGKLLETTTTMHSFARALHESGFREYMDYLGRPWYSFWINFVMGIARGLGFVVGATVIVAIVVWVVSRILTQLPFVGDFFETLQQFLSEENLKNIQSGNVGDYMNRMFEAFRANVLEGPSATPPTP